MKRSLFLLLLLLPALQVTAELPSWLELADRARWAANAHNMQSWRLMTVPENPGQRRLVLDSLRLLPQTDPFNRQMTISLGAFLRVLEDEARARGAFVGWEALEDQPGALVTLTEAEPVADPPGRVDALTAPTAKYRTAAFELPRALRTQQEARSDVHIRISWVTDAAELEATKVWAQRAFDLEMDLPRTRDESLLVTRYGQAARQAQPWGITLVPNFSPDQLYWIETLAAWFPQSPAEYARSAKQLLAEALQPVSQVVVLASNRNDNRARLETGRRLQQLWQEVRAVGGELLPLSQGLQEFPEMAPLFSEAHQRWAQPGETVQMVLALFRPRGGAALSSPRLPASALVE